MYLGATPFPISTRNSARAVAHLVARTGARRLLVSADPAMRRLAGAAAALLAAEGPAPVLLPVPCFGDLYGPGGDEALVPMGDVHEDRVSIIMHSSGGSGLRANALVPGSRPANV